MTAPTPGEQVGAVRDVPRRRRGLGLLGLLGLALLALLLLGLLLATLLGGGDGKPRAAAPPAGSTPAADPRGGLVGGVDVPARAATGRLAVPGGLGTVLFAEDATTLTPPGDEVVRQAAALIRRDRPAAVTVTGYTDRVGGKPANAQLSLQRAQEVTRALRAAVGPGPTTYRVKASGQDDAVADNATAQGRQQNRRATITTR